MLDSKYQAYTIDEYILLTECEGRTGRISARGLGSTRRGPYKKDRGPIFSQYGPSKLGQ